MKIFIIGGLLGTNEKEEEFNRFCNEIGKSLASRTIRLILCSPYPKSADYEIIKGIEQVEDKKLSIETHFPKLKNIANLWDNLFEDFKGKIKIDEFKHHAPSSDEQQALKNAWLFCQIQAISIADIVISIGGKIEGSSNLLVRIAEGQGKKILPIPKFGGVGELFFDKKMYQLKDYWGLENFNELNNCTSPSKIIDIIINNLKDNHFEQIVEKVINPTFFISYSRDKPANADYIEMLLRRRNYNIIRDETDISASDDIPNAIIENIHKSDVFIAVWCKEYACSPWCHDELNLALETHLKEGKSLWIIRTDDTRMIPQKARKLLYYDVRSRIELEARILSLIGDYKK